MEQIISIGSEGREKLIKGVNTLADAVTATLGPQGRNAIFESEGLLVSTKDGVSIVKHISELEDPIENLGVKMLKQAAIKTANKAGDGTTTSTLLAQVMINEGLKHLNNKCNAIEIKRGIESATKEVVKSLKTKISEKISSAEQLKQIAIISANNDPEIGELIFTALDKVGRDGVVHIEESKSGETFLETVEGMQFDRGYKSHFFVTNNNDMSCTLEDPLILILDKKLSKSKELLPILQFVSAESKPLFIISEDIDGEALSMCIVNKMRESIKVCAVKAPDFGDRRKLILEDIAVLTGGKVISPDKAMSLEKFDKTWFGEARVITITKDNTTIIDGKGKAEDIETRIKDLKTQIDKSITAFEKEKLQERLAKFSGGVSIIHVGGNTETEIREKKDRVEDSLLATKAAIEEGIIPGGGVSLLYARNSITFSKEDNDSDIKIGKQIVFNACAQPFIKILKNAGYEEIRIFGLINSLVSKSSKSKDFWKGYNLKTEKFTNMKDAGILDPTKVTRFALENATSVASTLLLTEVVVVDKKEKNKAPVNDMMGGMM